MVVSVRVALGLLLSKSSLKVSAPPSFRNISTSTCSMKIYTKTGDKGTSSLYSGERRPKDDVTFEALGNVDELNSIIGMALEHLRPLDSSTSAELESIQNSLFDLGASVATPLSSSSERKLQKTAFDADKTAELERWIDAHTEKLPPLKQFILPGGGHAAATLHLARSVCRRAERSVVPLVREGGADNSVGIFLNRLSDYLFTAARMASQAAGANETLYFPPR